MNEPQWDDPDYWNDPSYYQDDDDDWECANCNATNYGDENFCHKCNTHYMVSMLQHKKNKNSR